jgi:hypothetical protein
VAVPPASPPATKLTIQLGGQCDCSCWHLVLSLAPLLLQYCSSFPQEPRRQRKAFERQSSMQPVQLLETHFAIFLSKRPGCLLLCKFDYTHPRQSTWLLQSQMGSEYDAWSTPVTARLASPVRWDLWLSLRMLLTKLPPRRLTRQEGVSPGLGNHSGGRGGVDCVGNGDVARSSDGGPSLTPC